MSEHNSKQYTIINGREGRHQNNIIMNNDNIFIISDFLCDTNQYFRLTLKHTYHILVVYCIFNLCFQVQTMML